MFVTLVPKLVLRVATPQRELYQLEEEACYEMPSGDAELSPELYLQSDVSYNVHYYNTTCTSFLPFPVRANFNAITRVLCRK